MTVHSMDVVVVWDLAGKFASRKKFVEELKDLVPLFYEKIGQHLQAWVPAPPKIEQTDPIDEAPITDTPDPEPDDSATTTEQTRMPDGVLRMEDCDGSPPWPRSLHASRNEAVLFRAAAKGT